MAKRDWAQTNTDEWGVTYSRSVGERSCSIRAFGTWRQYCQLLFYLRDKKTHSWYRVTRSGEDWYENEDREEIPEYPTCGQAEKVALSWLRQDGGPAGAGIQKQSLPPRMEPKRARLIGSVDGETLYRSKSGVFFTDSLCDTEPKRITITEAKEWVKKNCSPTRYALVFDERAPVRVSLLIPAALLELIDAAKDSTNRSRNAVIVKGLEQYFSNPRSAK